jgi:tellurite resistance protein TerC
MVKAKLYMSYKMARRIVITVIGVSVLLIGTTLLVLPGPAFVVIPAGLAILGLEFAWAQRWLVKVRTGANYAFSHFKREPKGVPNKEPNSHP